MVEDIQRCKVLLDIENQDLNVIHQQLDELGDKIPSREVLEETKIGKQPDANGHPLHASVLCLPTVCNVWQCRLSSGPLMLHLLKFIDVCGSKLRHFIVC